MDSPFIAALALGFISGFKHAFEPDHVVAVSTLFQDQPKPMRAVAMGLTWGAGHTTTLVLGVLAIGALRLNITEAHLGYFELPVAVMLLALGGWSMYDAVKRMRSLRRHTHDGIEHYHVSPEHHPHPLRFSRTGWRGYVVGLVHGLAGSGALLLLIAATLPSLAEGILYAIVFGLGSVAGMGVVTAALAAPFLAASRRPVVHGVLTGVSGILSSVIGAGILYAAWGNWAK